MSTETTRRNPALASVIVGLILLVFYLLLPGRNHDGDALKQAQLHLTPPHIDAVNHPYNQLPFWAWLKAAPASVVGSLEPRMNWMAALNSVLGAAAAALSVRWLLAHGVRPLVASLVGLTLGLSNAWFYHSTQVTEPMLAQFIFLLALLAADSRRHPDWLWAALAGGVWAASVAAYQSFALAGPGVLVLIAQDRRRALGWLLGAGIVGTSLFSLAAILRGANSMGGIIGYLTDKPDGEWWGRWTLGAVGQLPIALAQAIAPPWPTYSWPGLRVGWTQLGPVLRGLLIFQVLVTVLAVGFAWSKLPWRNQTRTVLGLVLVLGLALFAPYYLKPYYNKLWLLPLSAAALLAGLGLQEMRRPVAGLVAFLSLMLVANTPRVYLMFSRPHPEAVATIAALETSLQPNDLLICDGWDRSLNFSARHPERDVFRVVSELGGPANLERRCQQAFQRGGRVFVLGLLELTETGWNGATDANKRSGRLTFADVQHYRPRAKLVWLGKDRGVGGDLYEILPAPAP